MAFCSTCNRVFKDDAALSMHLRDSKAHYSEPAATTEEEAAWKCVRCETEFDSREELRMHVLSSEKHFACVACLEGGTWQDFLTKRALKSHIWGKHKHHGSGRGSDESKKDTKGKSEKDTKGKGKVRETPLDGFFTSFVGFMYDARLSPEASWKKLRRFKGWKGPPERRSAAENDAWGGYQGALAREVEMWFGDEKDLTAWWTLCKAVGKVDPPDEIRECKKVCDFSISLDCLLLDVVYLVEMGEANGKHLNGRFFGRRMSTLST